MDAVVGSAGWSGAQCDLRCRLVGVTYGGRGTGWHGDRMTAGVGHGCEGEATPDG